ncbi:hypothetical protein ACJX0J_030789, partial [Zea mays]
TVLETNKWFAHCYTEVILLKLYHDTAEAVETTTSREDFYKQVEASLLRVTIAYVAHIF